MNLHERIQYRILRQAKNLVWLLDYAVWIILSPYKFKKHTKIESVLIIEDVGLGDLLVTTPVIRALNKKYGKVDVLVKPGMEAVLKGNPNVENIITEVKDNYDLGVILHARTKGNYKTSKMLKEKCKYRIGCTRVGFREGKGFFLNRKTVPNFKVKKKIQDNLDVIRTIGLNGDSHLEAYTDYVPPIQDYIVFHTYSAYKTHNWYKEKWIELAKKINHHIVFTGTNKKYVQDIIKEVDKTKVTDATGTTIKEYFGWIKHANQVITVDTSSMHIAAAFNKKVISLFGNGDPRIWEPETERSSVILKGDCHSCHLATCARKDHRCMKLIEPEDILNKLNLER
jgi:ADP-heptose:LPS heptosyltransferase